MSGERGEKLPDGALLADELDRGSRIFGSIEAALENLRRASEVHELEQSDCPQEQRPKYLSTLFLTEYFDDIEVSQSGPKEVQAFLDSFASWKESLKGSPFLSYGIKTQINNLDVQDLASVAHSQLQEHLSRQDHRPGCNQTMIDYWNQVLQRITQEAAGVS